MPVSSRLPHILPVRDLVRLLLPTYADASSVDDAEAQDRLERALADADLREDIYAAFERSLAEQRGPRSTEDQQLDRLSRAVGKRHNFKVVPATAPVAAAMVGINLAAGLGEGLAAALATEKGRALYLQGLALIAQELVKELVK
jgi:hypothetical protein